MVIYIKGFTWSLFIILNLNFDCYQSMRYHDFFLDSDFRWFCSRNISVYNTSIADILLKYNSIFYKKVYQIENMDPLVLKMVIKRCF